MKNSPGFGLVGFILMIMVIAVGALVYTIQVRAKEFLYYKELSKQRTYGLEDGSLCGEPINLTCDSGYTCVISPNSENGIGKCMISAEE